MLCYKTFFIEYKINLIDIVYRVDIFEGILNYCMIQCFVAFYLL